ncbi:TOBE domain-containing protein [Methylobacterium sp. J-043]|uniref:TOBE domain-containing protein n=1 Tax=Methylorubrum TaxID=2282523 RepID=UPI00209E3D61|nr:MULTISPECIES: TOBE domain-containing protein [Methylorubrum]MCJ2032058.1 TOBE domain-containing protein [Methylobacterium sp. J-043]MCP1548483.1 molybdopterin-binding protein [Methylorubrum zatmanii]MCP1554902.1 molybdopterin-binding protein [Methylorubrum extorquens]MCP1578786.1 molybdopterin-binding protein [Methylorubrum extorquens]
MKLSARNVLKGKVVSVEKGSTTAHVKIEIANGQVITSAITNESVDSLGLKVGGEAYAVIKSSDVIIAVD